nr:DUF3500 domain-containing protein [Asanoa siamensis]
MDEAALRLLSLVGPPLPYPFDDAGRRWIEYRPRTRPGVSLSALDPAARKAAFQLLATGLRDHAYAQALSIVSLEEVLDRSESFARGRHLLDYWVSVFGTPGSDAPWSWRFEGHHLSVSMTVVGSAVSPAPVFFGANPARVAYGGHTVSRPLAPEEDVALALLASLSPTERSLAVVSDAPPPDIASGTSEVAGFLTPAGVSATSLNPAAGALLAQLVEVYLDRLPESLAEDLSPSLESLRFAWSGPERPGVPAYYRIQAEDLLIEYDNTAGGNHAHTVLRRPSSDFGADLLAAHRRAYH